LVCREVGLAAPLMVAPSRSQHARPREFDTQVAAYTISFYFLTIFVDQYRLYPRQRQHGITRLRRGYICNGRYHNTSVLRLPPRIYNRCFSFPDLFIVPVPGFLIDGLTYRPELGNATQVFTLDKFITSSHQRPYSCRSCIQDI